MGKPSDRQISRGSTFCEPVTTARHASDAESASNRFGNGERTVPPKKAKGAWAGVLRQRDVSLRRLRAIRGSVRRFLERRPPFSRCSWEETRASMAMRSWIALTGSSSTTMTVPDGARYPLMAPSWDQCSAVLELIPIFWAERLRFIPNESTHLKVFSSICYHFLETFSTLIFSALARIL